MFQQLNHNIWLRASLVVLILGAVCMTTFLTTHRFSAKAAGNTSFNLTNGDTYTFTETTATSDTGGVVNVGSWNVTDTTTNTNLGTLSGTISTSQTGTYTTPDGTLTEPIVTEKTAINAPAPVGSFTSDFSTYPTDINYKTGSAYQSYVSAGDTETVAGFDATPMGSGYDELSCPGTSGGDCVQVGFDQSTSTALGTVTSSARTAMDRGVIDQNKGFNALDAITGLGTPSQLLARQAGGGPLAVRMPSIVPLLPLAVLGVGIAAAAGGLIISNICNIRSCSKSTSLALGIIGGFIAIAGGVIATASGAAFAPWLGAGPATASVAQVAAGFAETNAALAEGLAMTSTQLATLNENVALLVAAGASVTVG